MIKNCLFVFGMGYSASFVAKSLQGLDWNIVGTTSKISDRDQKLPEGVSLLEFSDQEKIIEALQEATHLLVSVPPDKDQGDVVLSEYTHSLLSLGGSLKWIGYLSTTGVYGDHQGKWVDENTQVAPRSERGKRRVEAEQGWMNLGDQIGIPVHLFRLAGIYGPGRNVFAHAKHVQPDCIYKPGHYFSRIHVVDLANVLIKSMKKENKHNIYNVCDDEPAPFHAIIEYACALSKMPLPKWVAIEDAHLSDFAKSFYEENKRVSNTRIKEELVGQLLYPTFREGLKSLMEEICIPY